VLEKLAEGWDDREGVYWHTHLCFSARGGKCRLVLLSRDFREPSLLRWIVYELGQFYRHGWRVGILCQWRRTRSTGVCN